MFCPTGRRGCEYWAILGVWGRILGLLSTKKKQAGVWVGMLLYKNLSEYAGPD